MEAQIRIATPEDSSAVATVLIESRRAFLPFAPSAHPPGDIRRWVATRLVPSGKVHVATVDQQVVAVLAVSEDETSGWIDQLYLLPGYTGFGLGQQLLALAHRLLRRPIRLHTFQANAGARRFYERHGYRAIAFSDGAKNEEKCPDVLYEFTGDPLPIGACQMSDVVSPANVAASLTELWSPRVVAELDDSYLKVAKVQGNFTWHSHDSEDELFFVLKGSLTIEMEDRTVVLNEGQAFVVPKGVRHNPRADSECHIMLIERKSTLHTGGVQTDKTRSLTDQLRPI